MLTLQPVPDGHFELRRYRDTFAVFQVSHCRPLVPRRYVGRLLPLGSSWRQRQACIDMPVYHDGCFVLERSRASSMPDLSRRAMNLRTASETPWPDDECAGPGMPCPACNANEPPDLPPDFTSIKHASQ
jgi:hypothetical protein